jgi:hypothetical protein
MHPTIKTPEQGISVLNRFASDFQKPTVNEGHDRLIYLKVSEQTLHYTSGEVGSILQRLRNASPPMTEGLPKIYQRGSQHFRGNGSRGNFTPGHNKPRVRGHGLLRQASDSRGGWRLGDRQSLPSATMTNSLSHEVGENSPISSETLASQTRPSDSEDGGFHGDSRWRGSGSAHDPFTII